VALVKKFVCTKIK